MQFWCTKSLCDYVWGSKCYTWNITIHKFAVKRAAAYLGTGTLQSNNQKNKCSSDASNPSMAIHVGGSKHYMKHYRTQICSQKSCSLSWYMCVARLQLTFFSQKELQYILVQVHCRVTVDSLESKQQQQILVQVHWKVTVNSQMLMQYILVQASHCKITVATLLSN